MFSCGDHYLEISSFSIYFCLQNLLLGINLSLPELHCPLSSQERNILWVSFPNKNLVSSIFKRQTEIGRPNVRLLKYIPPWCYDRNKELEILCRLEREKDPNLRTKILLGHRDLKLSVKKKGETFYKRVSVEHLGKIPGFNFFKILQYV